MATLELQVAGDIPAGLDMEPTERVFSALAGNLPDLPEGVVNVALVDDAQIQAANREYSDQDYATDVLSFSYIEDGGEPIEGVIGEIMISLETATRQATAASTTLPEEVALLTLHGVLHILGYDHQTPEQREQVQQLQRDLMATAGYNYREFEWKD